MQREEEATAPRRGRRRAEPFVEPRTGAGGKVATHAGGRRGPTRIDFETG